MQSSGWLSILLGLARKQLGNSILENNPSTSSPLWSPELAQVLPPCRKCSVFTCLKPMRRHCCAPAPYPWAADILCTVHLIQPKWCSHLSQPGLGALSGSAGHWQLGARRRLSSPGTCWAAPAGLALQTSAWSPSGSTPCPGLMIRRQEVALECDPGRLCKVRA